MLPQQDNPLTRAYIAGARATTHDSMLQAMEIIRLIEQATPEIIREQCKLAAEILIERKET